MSRFFYTSMTEVDADGSARDGNSSCKRGKCRFLIVSQPRCVCVCQPSAHEFGSLTNVLHYNGWMFVSLRGVQGIMHMRACSLPAFCRRAHETILETRAQGEKNQTTSCVCITLTFSKCMLKSQPVAYFLQPTKLHPQPVKQPTMTLS